MSKEAILKIVGISVILVLISIAFNKCTRSFVDNMIDEMETTSVEVSTEELFEYSLNEPPIKYGVDKSKEAKTEYFEYLKQYIKPTKLINFIQVRDLYEGFYNKNGNKMLNMLKFCAYRHLFESMYSADRKNFDDCPVSEKFLKKFNINLASYFNIKHEEIVLRNLKEEENKFEIESWWNLGPDGEPANGRLYVFKYLLDEYGNVDDIILDYSTGDF